MNQNAKKDPLQFSSFEKKVIKIISSNSLVGHGSGSVIDCTYTPYDLINEFVRAPKAITVDQALQRAISQERLFQAFSKEGHNVVY